MLDNLQIFLNQAANEDWAELHAASFSKKVRHDLKVLKNEYKSAVSGISVNPVKNVLFENYYMLERECKSLIKCASVLSVSSIDGFPVLGIMAQQEGFEVSTQSISEGISLLHEIHYVSNADISLVGWAIKLAAVDMAAKACEKSDVKLIDRAISMLYACEDIDSEELNSAVNPLEKAFLSDEIYPLMSKDTRRLYRDKTTRIAQATGVPEHRLAAQYISQCKKPRSYLGNHVGNYIYTDFSRVFQPPKFKIYSNMLWVISLVLSLFVSAIIHSFWAWILLYFPVYSIAKVVADGLVMRNVYKIGSEPLPKMELSGEIPAEHKTVAVVSALVSCEGDFVRLERGIDELSRTNPAKNLCFCLLCDLKEAKTAETESDEGIIEEARLLYARLKPEISEKTVIIIRNRSFSKTQNIFTGRERKRGAIEDLVRYIFAGTHNFRLFIGSHEALVGVKHILALDSDTRPLMNTVYELVSVAAHPLNKPEIDGENVKSGFGIIAPRMTTELESSIKTPFSQYMGGFGGTCTYDSFAADLYQNGFSSGIFAGKGLIDAECFYKCCVNRFPDEQVLSHDILEGAVLKTAFAGDIEFSDSFPTTSIAYYKRLERWLRGDMQNIGFALKASGLGEIDRFKLFDNIRRCITPIFLLALFLAGAYIKNGWILLLIGLISVAVPFAAALMPHIFRFGSFGFSRKFYSGAKPQASLLTTQLLLNLILVPKTAFVSLKATVLALWRLWISRKNLLQWTTAAQSDRLLSTPAITAKSLIWAEIAALAMTVSLNPFAMIIGVVMLCAVPVMIYCNSPRTLVKAPSNPSLRSTLVEELKKMWQFYEDYVSPSDNFLPPDNVQYSPIYAVAHRTSPTNIGMYLASVLAARDMGFIDSDGLYSRISATISTVERLDHRFGNLYNWYDTRTLSTLNRIVSSVDSGNFLCAITALKEGLSEYVHENPRLNEVKFRLQALIDRADMGIFYNRSKGLLSICFDESTGEFSKNHYDLLMSEARMTSYFAIAKGQVPKEHWRRLSHIMSRLGSYAGPMSWTGTMFEYFMPELFLRCPIGSLGYEALKYAVYCQKQRSLSAKAPFGISESGFYAFDNMLNYQYKAHGVQYLGLKRNLDRELVVSPYSSFLILGYDEALAVNNLVRLEKLGMSHPRYGFYEAVDFTRERVGDTGFAIVKSHMAHHVGMSILSTANCLMEGVFQKRFLRDSDMGRARELLEQKIIAGEIILEDYHRKEPPLKLAPPTGVAEEFTEITPFTKRSTLSSNGEFTAIYADCGIYLGIYQGKNTVIPTRDFLRRQHGGFFALLDGDKALHFGNAIGKGFADEQSVVFGNGFAEYYSNGLDLRAGMRASVHAELPCEIRRFAVLNNANRRRTITLSAFIEPLLASAEEFEAHPAFANLFLKIRFDSDRKIFIISRKERKGDNVDFMAIGFIEDVEIEYCLNREKALGNGLSRCFFMPSGEGSHSPVPSPCLLLNVEMKLDSARQSELSLFTVCGKTEAELYTSVDRLRNDRTTQKCNFFAYESLEGRLALRLLPSVAFGKIESKEIMKAITENLLCSSELWSLGISGDLPIVLMTVGNGDGDKHERFAALVAAQHKLRLCRLRFDLVFVLDGEQKDFTELFDNEIKRSSLYDMRGKKGGIFLFHSSDIAPERLVMLKAFSSVYGLDFLSEAVVNEYSPFVLKQAQPKTVNEHGIAAGAGIFTEKSFIITQKPPVPWCNVLANSRFGTLVSEKSLGFSWAVNSRENKLTPWYNDTSLDNDGEMLVLHNGNDFFDVINGSAAEFAANSANYKSICGDISCEVWVKVSAVRSGKMIEIILENNSDNDKNVSLAYYTEPVLGVDRRQARLAPKLCGNIFTLENKANIAVSGFAGIAGACEKADGETEKSYVTSRADFWQGRWEKTDISACDNPCATVIIKRELPPKQPVRFRFILAFAEKEKLLKRQFMRLSPSAGVKYEQSIKVSTPDKLLDNLVNNWLPWQTLGCRMYARTAFYQNGGAFGFRDQLQDALSAVFYMPSAAKKQIIRACHAQFPEGDVLHWWHSLPNCKKGVRTRYSDDLLWLPYVLADYVKKTGDENLLRMSVHFIDGEKLGDRSEAYIEVRKAYETASVYEHAKRSITHGFRLGSHGLILMGSGDWNDGYNNVGALGKGESVWLSQFMVMVLEDFAVLSERMSDFDYAEKCRNRALLLRNAIEQHCWDGTHYIRAFYDDGSKMGSDECDECRIDLLPQAFAELCGLSDESRRKMALESALSRLVDEELALIRLFEPAFSGKGEKRPGYVASYPTGVRENGGQYTHGAVWFAMAMLKSGNVDEGFRLINMLNPARRWLSGMGDAYKTEPYYLAADIYTNPSAKGRGGWSIYTGAAAWYYKCIVEEFLGIIVTEKGISLNPQLPSEWDGFEAEIDMCNTTIKLEVSKSLPVGLSDNGSAAGFVPFDGKAHEVRLGVR